MAGRTAIGDCDDGFVGRIIDGFAAIVRRELGRGVVDVLADATEQRIVILGDDSDPERSSWTDYVDWGVRSNRSHLQRRDWA